MKPKLLLATLLFVLLAGLAQAQTQTRLNFAGTYSVRGTNPDGTTYTGSMVVTSYGDGYRITQTLADGTVYRGIGNDMGPYLTVAIQSGTVPSIAIYRVTQSTTLEGFWQDYDSEKEGSEALSVAAGSNFPIPSAINVDVRYNYSGTYSVRGTNPDGTTYTGTMVVSPYGDGYRVTQTYADGTVWRGIGNDIADYFAVAYMANSGPTVQIYQRDRSNALNGFWQSYNNTKEGQETATRR